MVTRLSKSVGGIRNLNWPIGALIVVDVLKEQSAIQEAAIMGVPVVAIVDTNGDPSLVDFVIPANDDAPRSIQVVIDYLADAAAKGKAAAQAKAHVAREAKKEKREAAPKEAAPKEEKVEMTKAAAKKEKREEAAVEETKAE